jgi:hypothetical protein
MIHVPFLSSQVQSRHNGGQINKRRRRMNYMFLIYRDETTWPNLSQEERDQVRAGHWALIDETNRLGIFRAGAPLHATATATTVRTGAGKVLTTDGPFAETKEQLGGYYILDCKDLDEAIEWAAKIPVGEGCVEIRPVMDIPPRN